MIRIVSVTVSFLDRFKMVTETWRSTYTLGPVAHHPREVYSSWFSRIPATDRKRITKAKAMVKICTTQGTFHYRGH